MRRTELIAEEVLIETARRIGELECLFAQTVSDEERISLRIAIAELKHVILAHSYGSTRVN